MIMGANISGETAVWTTGMAEWKKASEIECFQLWHYLSTSGKQEGPMWRDKLYKLFSDGEIDGTTKVWSPGTTEWKEIMTVPRLKQYIQVTNAAAAEKEKSLNQIYAGPAAGEARTYTAEDGTVYDWDEQSKEWKPAEEGEAKEGVA